MTAARPSHALDAEFTELSDQRRFDRRAKERRAPRVKLDPLFATTLINQIAKPEAPQPKAYTAPQRAPRPGIVVNVSA